MRIELVLKDSNEVTTFLGVVDYDISNPEFLIIKKETKLSKLTMYINKSMIISFSIKEGK